MSKSTLRIRADKAKKFRCKNLIVVLENPKTIANIGSVMRNVDALGGEKVYVVDGYNLLPNTWLEIREKGKLKDISASANKWVFVKKFNNAQDCLNHLKTKDFISIATSPHSKGKENVPLQKGNYTQKRLAVWFGNESQGLSEEVLDSSKFCVQIPMCGIIESLNLGTTTGIVLYEITKQRRNFKK